MQRKTTIFEDNVASRIEALLARCDRIRLARDLDRPTTFDARGQAHAEQVAKQEAERHG